ncbi:MAG: glycosyltransferase family 87 protein [Pseudomonadota bacterium]|nr:glycosyltransferase family 87 protein [Pseudomonadota bacterium]
MSGRVLLVLGLLAHLWFGLRPAWERVSSTPSGRDFASYYYAVQVAADGGDPYDTDALDAKARAERTRKEVHPYFYPPPFLLTMTWALPLSLPKAYVGMLVLNEALLATVVALCLGPFGVAPWAVALLLAAYSPIPDNAWMGQANLLALAPALAGLALARRRPVAGGVLVGLAAMLKMSPALFLLYWAVQGRWRPVAAAIATAVLLSVATLPLVGFADQLRFYTDILPGFSSGDYHGLTVPITLPANHSIPDLFNQLWPGPTRFRLSEAAQTGSAVVGLALLGLWALRFRGPPAHDPDPAAIGALSVLMVMLPVYTYEHHLVFLLLAVGAALTVRPGLLTLLIAFFLAWPLDWLRAAQGAVHGVPYAGAVVRESKFLAELALFAVLLSRPRRR